MPILDLHPTSNYSQELYDFLKQEGIEGYRDRVYVVSGEYIATIGGKEFGVKAKIYTLFNSGNVVGKANGTAVAD